MTAVTHAGHAAGCGTHWAFSGSSGRVKRPGKPSAPTHKSLAFLPVMTVNSCKSHADKQGKAGPLDLLLHLLHKAAHG